MPNDTRVLILNFLHHYRLMLVGAAALAAVATGVAYSRTSTTEAQRSSSASAVSMSPSDAYPVRGNYERVGRQTKSRQYRASISDAKPPNGSVAVPIVAASQTPDAVFAMCEGTDDVSRALTPIAQSLLSRVGAVTAVSDCPSSLSLLSERYRLGLLKIECSSSANDNPEGLRFAAADVRCVVRFRRDQHEESKALIGRAPSGSRAGAIDKATRDVADQLGAAIDALLEIK